MKFFGFVYQQSSDSRSYRSISKDIYMIADELLAPLNSRTEDKNPNRDTYGHKMHLNKDTSTRSFEALGDLSSQDQDR